MNPNKAIWMNREPFRADSPMPILNVRVEDYEQGYIRIKFDDYGSGRQLQVILKTGVAEMMTNALLRSLIPEKELFVSDMREKVR
jgi:hypothetical protein